MSKAYNPRLADDEAVDDEYTTIRISKENKKRLEEHGDFGMSHDDVMNRILTILEKQRDDSDE